MRTLSQVLILLTLISVESSASVPPQKSPMLVDQLGVVRRKLLNAEKDLIESVKGQKKAQLNVHKIKQLMELQKEESKIAKKRLEELGSVVSELENRKLELNEKIKSRNLKIRKFLVSMNNTFSLGETSIIPEDFIGPKRHVLGHLVENGLKEIAIIRVDLEDALILEGRIQEEKQHLAYLVQDLSEQEMILEFNKELQNDILKKKHELRIAQFESYKKLKETEMQVEQLIGQFNSRKELEKVEEAQRVATISARVGEFQKMKGKLLFPVSKGQVIAGFGKAFDSKSGLYVFKKGIDISTGKELPVRSVSEGKVAYSGELNGYGKVTIIDHGHQYYSLMANLGELTKRAGDNVSAGDTIGRTDDLGTPVYFEIRARNVAVNPLQWLAN